MKAIAAVSKDWAIGLDNKLLFSIHEDMKLFRTTTSGKVVVMGRKTLESFPGGRPLKNRVNIVITKNMDYVAEGAVIIHSLEELDEAVKQYDTDDVYVIGGGSIYNALINRVDTALITKVDKSVPADTYFPNLDESEDWVLSEEGEAKEEDGTTFRFNTYKKVR